MPPAPAAPPPASPPPSQSVQIIDTGPPKPPPPPTSTILVSQMGKSASPPPKPDKGKAMDKVFDDLRKKAKAPEPAAATAPELPPAKPEGQSAEAQPPDKPADAAAQPPAEAAAAEPAAQPTSKEKVSPWKMVDEYKGRVSKLEKELSEAKSQLTPETERKQLLERVTKAEQFATQMADEIRYYNYEKSPDFQKNFQEPYESAFRRAMEDLTEVQVSDPGTGAVRQMTPDDLAQLAFMPFTKAKETAQSLFPDFAEDVMAARKEIRIAWDKRSGALKEWKEKGLEHQKSLMAQAQAMQEQTAKFVAQIWEKANKDAVEDPKFGTYFSPRKDDPEWNRRLAKGYELVDKAYSESPLDTKLTPEQRAEVVRRHAAVRARAAGWSALRNENETLRGKLEAIQKELDSYKGATPPAGGTTPESPASGGQGKVMDQVLADLRKRAR